jgi:hypothetical protein
MKTRYNIKSDATGWTVYDISTGLPAEINGAIQIGLTVEDADDLADLLNRLHVEESAAASH